MSGRRGSARQLEAGIGDQGRAGVGHQRHRGAVREPRQDFRPRFRGVVLVIGRERGRYPVVVDQLAGDAGILAGDEVGRRQGLERPQRDVAQIADRGCHHMQAARQRGRVDRLALEEVPPGGRRGAGGAGGTAVGAWFIHGNHEFSGIAPLRHRRTGNRYPFHLLNYLTRKCRIAVVEWRRLKAL